MKNISSRYVVSSKYNKNFIKGYNRDDVRLVATFDDNRKWRLDPTDSNYNALERRMDAQTMYQVKKVLPNVKADKIIDIVGTVLCISACIVTKLFNLPIDEQIRTAIHYTAGILASAGITLTACDIAKIRSILKYNLFINNRDAINRNVESSHNMLAGTSNKTRNAILNGTEEQPVTYANIDSISLDDMNTILDNIDIQSENGFELSDPIKRTRKKRK